MGGCTKRMVAQVIFAGKTSYACIGIRSVCCAIDRIHIMKCDEKTKRQRRERVWKWKGPVKDLYQSDLWLMDDPRLMLEYGYDYEKDEILHLIEGNGTLSRRNLIARWKVVGSQN